VENVRVSSVGNRPLRFPKNLKVSCIKVCMHNLLRKVFSRENLYALLLCLLVIALIILTASQSPQWIYQGF